MVLLRPTRPHAAQLVFHCLDLSKDPNWSSCMHPETHLAIRDCRHLCRSPSCCPCFLHLKNHLVDALDLFFIPVHPKDSQKKLVQLRRGRPQSECKSRAAFPVSTSSKSRLETSSPRFNSTSHFLARATLHFANTSKPLSIRRSLSSCLLKHGMLELKLFLMCSRLAVSLTAHASPAHLSSGFLRAWSKIGPFERSSSRCGQPMFWSHAHVEK